MSSANSATFDLDVGVIYSGERHYMTPLVTSLAGAAPGLSIRLILVDNASPDGVADWTHVCSHTKLVTNTQPCHYAANLNRVLAASDARYALLLNTDMYFDADEQCLAKMVKFMDDHPRAGISICRIDHPDGTYGQPARRFPTVRTIAARRLGMKRLFARSLAEYFYEDRDRQSSFVCDWISGCFMLVRRDAVREVGRFDEGYVKYFEDVDICLRMARAGWHVMFNGQTHCYHHEQRASRRALSRDAWWHVRAYLRWLYKWGLTVPRAEPSDASGLPWPPAGAPQLRRDRAHPAPAQPRIAATPERDQDSRRTDVQRRR